MDTAQSESLPQVSPIPQSKSATKTEKIIGYALLSLGLLIISASAFMAFSIFTGKQKAPQVFKIEAPSIPLPQANLDLSSNSAVPPELAKSIKNSQSQTPQSVKIFSDDVFSALINTGLFYLLAMFLASVGAKFADIGIKLLKEFKIQIK